MKKRINLIIAVLCFLIVVLLGVRMTFRNDWIGMVIAAVAGLIHLYLGLRQHPKERSGKQAIRASGSSWNSSDGAEQPPRGALTELILLSEEDGDLASWNIYGKNGVVVGRDIGENNVTVDLNQTTYASMIDVEHAVLNFSGEDWYLEDISEKNGVSIQKQDGRKYKISYGKPCKLERGDIIFIALTRLQIL